MGFVTGAGSPVAWISLSPLALARDAAGALVSGRLENEGPGILPS